MIVAEILEELEIIDRDGITGADIFIGPPEGCESEEDSGDYFCNDPDRLSRNQLRVPAEVQIIHSTEENGVF